MLIVIIWQSLFAEEGSAIHHKREHGAHPDHKGKDAVTPPPKGLSPSKYAMMIRRLLCDLCPRMWKSYGKRCVSKKIKPFWKCRDTDLEYEEEHAHEIGRTGKCLERFENRFVEECREIVGKRHKDPVGKLDLQLYDVREPVIEAKPPGGISGDDEFDVPIGWRTIQGEWFPKRPNQSSR